MKCITRSIYAYLKLEEQAHSNEEVGEEWRVMFGASEQRAAFDVGGRA